MGEKARAPDGRTAGLTLVDRLATIGDQAVTSVANLLLTLMLARHYEPVCLAGFAIGSSLALLVQGIYRSSIVLPASLLEIAVFRIRAARLVGQHVALIAGVTALTAAIAFAAAAIDPTSMVEHTAAASMACVLLFVPIDFDRMLMLRLGFRKLPLGIASAYLALLGGLLLLVSRFGLSFFWLMAVLGAFSLGRIVLYAGLLVRPDFRHSGTLLRVSLRRNVHWGAINTIAAGGYYSVPVLLLGWSAPALNVAAYNAMRNLTQPLQLLLRSLDIVDKLIFSTLDRSDPAEQRAHILFVLVLYAALSVAFTAVIAVAGGPLTRLAFGARYDGFGDTLVLWSAVTGLTCCLAPLETVIYRTGRLKAYALVQLIAGVCALLAAHPLIRSFSDLGAVAATLMGTAIAFLGLVGICASFLGLRRLRWPKLGLPAAGGASLFGIGRRFAARSETWPSHQRIHARLVASPSSEARLSEGTRMFESSVRRPRQTSPSFADQDLGPPHLGDDAAGFLDTLRRHRQSIAAVTLGLPAAAVVLMLALPFRYTAWSEISIDPRGQKTTETDIVPSGYGNDIAISDSQIKIITSDAVLLPVVQDLHLAEDPDFGPTPIANITARLERLLGRGPAPDGDRDLDALRILRQRVSAKRAERTYILDIGASSSTPGRAVILAQAVTNSYLADHQRAEAETVRSVAGFLSSRLDDLRTSLINAEKRVEDYKESHHLVTVNDVQVTEQQLSDLNSQLATASARETQAQAHLDAISRIRAEKGDPGSLTAALSSPMINELRKQAAEAGRSEAMMAATLGPRHPALHEAHQQTVKMKALIGDEIRRISEAARTDLMIARGDESALKGKIAALQTATVSTNRSLLGLREFEREVEVRRSTYQAFLSRSQAADEQQNAAVTNLRVISPATAPDRRDGPARPVLAVVALLMGMLIGIGQALVRDRMVGLYGSAQRYCIKPEPSALHEGAVSSPH